MNEAGCTGSVPVLVVDSAFCGIGFGCCVGSGILVVSIMAWSGMGQIVVIFG